jgi:hypothetical protein
MVVQERSRARSLDLLHGRLDFSALGGLAAAYQVSPQTVVVETKEGREIRITAKRDLSTATFVSDYERRSVVTSGGNTYHVWSRTGAYPTWRADDVDACLEGAMQEVSRLPVL